MKEKRKVWAMPSKDSKVVLLHCAAYSSPCWRETAVAGKVWSAMEKNYPGKSKTKLKAHSYPCRSSFWQVLSTKTVLWELQHNRKSAQIACWNSLHQLHASLEMTKFTLLLSCIYCAWTSQSHFTAFHRNYINWYTQSHQNLSSKNKNIFIPYTYIIKSWLYFQETTLKETV